MRGYVAFLSIFTFTLATTDGGKLTATYNGDPCFSGSPVTSSLVTLVKTSTDTTEHCDPAATTPLEKCKPFSVCARIATHSGYGTQTISVGPLTITDSWSGGSMSCVPAVSSNLGGCQFTAPATVTLLSVTVVYAANASFAGSSTSSATSYSMH